MLEVLKLTRGVGYIVTSCILLSVHPFVVVDVNVIVYTISVLVVFSGNVITGSKSVGFTIVAGKTGFDDTTVQLCDVAYCVLLFGE